LGVGRLLALARGKFAHLDPVWQARRDRGDLFLAIGGDEFAERGAERGLSEEIDVDAVENRFREGFADIGERGPPRIGHAEFVQRMGH